MTYHGWMVIGLLFTAAALGVVATAPTDVVPPLIKLICAAIAAGSAAVLAVLEPVRRTDREGRQ
jgi:hypothetical protein